MVRSPKPRRPQHDPVLKLFACDHLTRLRRVIACRTFHPAGCTVHICAHRESDFARVRAVRSCLEAMGTDITHCTGQAWDYSLELWPRPDNG